MSNYKQLFYIGVITYARLIIDDFSQSRVTMLPYALHRKWFDVHVTYDNVLLRFQYNIFKDYIPHVTSSWGHPSGLHRIIYTKPLNGASNMLNTERYVVAHDVRDINKQDVLLIIVKITYSTYQEMCTQFVFCCVLLWFNIAR